MTIAELRQLPTEQAVQLVLEQLEALAPLPPGLTGVYRTPEQQLLYEQHLARLRMRYFSFDTEQQLFDFLRGARGPYYMFEAPAGKFWVSTSEFTTGGSTDPTEFKQAEAEFLRQYHPEELQRGQEDREIHH